MNLMFNMINRQVVAFKQSQLMKETKHKKGKRKKESKWKESKKEKKRKRIDIGVLIGYESIESTVYSESGL